MMTLDFLTGVHRDGVNVTVRRGSKWANSIGQVVLLSTNGKPNTEKGWTMAKIFAYTAKAFKDITPDDIQDEHDPECRTIDGLRAFMEKAYSGFQETDMCLILRYIPLDIS